MLKSKRLKKLLAAQKILKERDKLELQFNVSEKLTLEQRQQQIYRMLSQEGTTLSLLSSLLTTTYNKIATIEDKLPELKQNYAFSHYRTNNLATKYKEALNMEFEKDSNKERQEHIYHKISFR